MNGVIVYCSFEKSVQKKECENIFYLEVKFAIKPQNHFILYACFLSCLEVDLM